MDKQETLLRYFGTVESNQCFEYKTHDIADYYHLTTYLYFVTNIIIAFDIKLYYEKSL